MKRTLAIVAGLLMLTAMPVYAANASAPTITTQAEVDGTLSITVQLFRGSVAPANQITPATSMDFGQLQDLGTSTLRATEPIIALITTNSHSVPYTVTQTATSLTSGANQLNDNTFVVSPVYVASDNGGASNEGSLGSQGVAVATDKALYTSGGTNSLRTIRAVYAISDDPADGVPPGNFIPLDQPAGNYAGTLIITAST